MAGSQVENDDSRTIPKEEGFVSIVPVSCCVWTRFEREILQGYLERLLRRLLQAGRS